MASGHFQGQRPVLPRVVWWAILEHFTAASARARVPHRWANSQKKTYHLRDPRGPRGAQSAYAADGLAAPPRQHRRRYALRSLRARAHSAQIFPPIRALRVFAVRPTVSPAVCARTRSSRSRPTSTRTLPSSECRRCAALPPPQRWVAPSRVWKRSVSEEGFSMGHTLTTWAVGMCAAHFRLDESPAQTRVTLTRDIAQLSCM